MNKIIIKTITIDNFKGIKHLEMPFNEKNTKIYAQNGSGKSTIKNAWEWVLGQDVKNYIPNIDNQELLVETSVNVDLLVNNEYNYNLKRVSKPKMQNGVKVGNESVYMIDGIEMIQKNYIAQLNSIFTNNSVDNIKILTDKDFFNTDTTTWKWNNRRKILMQMCNIDEATKDIINQDKYILIKNDVLKGFATSDLKSKFEKDRKTLKDNQLKNQALIDQKQSEINEYLGIDFVEIGKKLGLLKAKHTKLLKASKKETQSEVLENLQKELFDTTNELSKKQIEYTNKKQKLENEKITTFNKANELKLKIDALKSNSKICPNCGRELNEDMIANNQETLNQYMYLYNETYDLFEATNQKLQNMEEIKVINDLQDKITNLKLTIENTKTKDLNNLSSETITDLETQISALEKQMSRKEDLVKWNNQIKQWRKENLQFADEIIDIETKLRVLQDYIKEQTDIVSKTINDKFGNGVSWLLYNTNYVGNLEETCVAMYNNKLYSSLSNGEKNICDIEVVKALQKYFDVELPILADNEEANTIKYEANQQLIQFYVKENATIQGCEKY